MERNLRNGPQGQRYGRGQRVKGRGEMGPRLFARLSRLARDERSQLLPNVLSAHQPKSPYLPFALRLPVWPWHGLPVGVGAGKEQRGWSQTDWG